MREEWDDVPQDAMLAEVYPQAVRMVKTGESDQLKRWLCAYPALAKARSRRGRTLLHHLCDWPGHLPNALETGQALVDAGADVNARAIDAAAGETGLQWACSNDDAALADWLIDAGASVNGLNDDRRPLAQAIWYGCHRVKELLVRKGALLDLELAAGLGRSELLPSYFAEDGSLLPSAGPHRPPVSATEAGDGSREERLAQALVYAVIGGSAEAAAELLDRGAPVNAMPPGFDRLRATPLHWAACGTGVRADSQGASEDAADDLRLVKLLVRRGADRTAVDPVYGSTPLGWARHFGRTAIADWLEDEQVEPGQHC
ncbi:ankyrin repeat domain-containing protein [Cohnella nanjingensis]|uniref:Ankyrin repeat domain-containing protein n=1 Tax=Cohnella nanjingensis TaxID=1387779 RepID=A0A7X0RSI8_9BACL|nr:ankyrin repeat domain-containing protein [Cohnella nanjingensis]MBB6672703.1 ankyrin repeat domain-containing protein [Cohnella nanjingensis]